MLRVVSIALGLSLTPVAAFADSCVMQMAKIDAVLANTKASKINLTRVMQLRKLGGEQCKAGNETAASAYLRDVEKLLGL